MFFLINEAVTVFEMDVNDPEAGAFLRDFLEEFLGERVRTLFP